MMEFRIEKKEPHSVEEDMENSLREILSSRNPRHRFREMESIISEVMRRWTIRPVVSTITRFSPDTGGYTDCLVFNVICADKGQEMEVEVRFDEYPC